MNHSPQRSTVRSHTLRRRRGEDRERKRFYDSARWQHTRAAKLQRDPLCQYCAFQGDVTAATEVDHYVRLSEGGHPTADENLVSACHPCHSRKTLCEQTGKPSPQYVPGKARELWIA